MGLADVLEIVTPGVEGACPSCSFTGVCAGNVDGDATLDVWSISTETRTMSDGQTVPAGVPYNHQNDV